MNSANQGAFVEPSQEDYFNSRAVGGFPRGRGEANIQRHQARGNSMNAPPHGDNASPHQESSSVRGRGIQLPSRGGRGGSHGLNNSDSIAYRRDSLDRFVEETARKNSEPSNCDRGRGSYPYNPRGRGAFAQNASVNNAFDNAPVSFSQDEFDNVSGTNNPPSFQQPQDINAVRGNRGNFNRGMFFSRGRATSFRQPQRDSPSFEASPITSRGRGSGGNSFPLGVRGRSSFNTASVASNIIEKKTDESVKNDIEVVREKEIPRDLPISDDDKEIFDEEVMKKFAEEKLPPSRAIGVFEPAVRDANSLFEEDEKHAAEYATIFDQDEQVIVEGLHGKKLTEILTWSEACFCAQLEENIKLARYPNPRKIQCSVIPLIIEGYNMKVQSETGTGKTAAFILPIIDLCYWAKKDKKYVSRPYVPYAVILAPTRDLVMQSYEQANKFSDGINVSVAKAIGEYSTQSNIHELVECDILCATPGRFYDFVQKGKIILSEVRFLVFDEGDSLLSPSFKRIIDNALFGVEPKISNDRQTLFFSATFNSEAHSKANSYMRYGKTVTVRNEFVVPSKKCAQEFVVLKRTDKFKKITVYFIKQLAKVGNDKTKLPRTFIFCNTTVMCQKVAIALDKKGVSIIPFSGIMGQDLREQGIREFRENIVTVLCVSDLASRGVDFKDIDLVINYDMPSDYTTYVHRVGRAGRIRNGKSISFVVPETDGPLVHEIKMAMEKAGREIPQSLFDAADSCILDDPKLIGFGNRFKMLNDVSANKIEEVSAAVIKEEVEKPSVAPTEVTSATNVTSIGADKDATVDTVNVENAAADMKVEENKSKAVDQVKEKKPVEVVSDNYKVPILDQSEPTASVSGENEFVADNDKVQFLSNEVPTLDQIKPLASGSGDNVEKLVDADKKEDEKPAEVVTDSVIVVAQNNAPEDDSQLGDGSGQSTQDVAEIVADEEVQTPFESKETAVAEQSAGNTEKKDVSTTVGPAEKEAALKMLRLLQQSGHQIPQSAFDAVNAVDFFNESVTGATVATNVSTENATQASSADVNQEVEVQEEKEDKNAGLVKNVADEKVESPPPTVPVDEMKAEPTPNFNGDVQQPSLETDVYDDGW